MIWARRTRRDSRGANEDFVTRGFFQKEANMSTTVNVIDRSEPIDRCVAGCPHDSLRTHSSGEDRLWPCQFVPRPVFIALVDKLHRKARRATKDIIRGEQILAVQAKTRAQRVARRRSSERLRGMVHDILPIAKLLQENHGTPR